MIVATDKPNVKVPSTYRDWLECFNQMQNGLMYDEVFYAAISKGSFVGNKLTKSAFQKQLVNTVNTILDKNVKRFSKDLNEIIIFNEFSELELLFRRFRKNIYKVLFFDNFIFLPKTFRDELKKSIMKQMSEFWEDTKKFLYLQTMEFSNSELDDAVFLINRIKLF